MRATIELPSGDSETVVRAALYLLDALVAVNVQYLRAHPSTPKLHEARIRFRPEPWKMGDEHFDPIWLVMRRGWGDCDDLCGWRVAELQVAGEKATPMVSWPKGSRKYHAKVRRGDGSWEDPSLHAIRNEVQRRW